MGEGRGSGVREGEGRASGVRWGRGGKCTGSGHG